MAHPHDTRVTQCTYTYAINPKKKNSSNPHTSKCNLSYFLFLITTTPFHIEYGLWVFLAKSVIERKRIRSLFLHESSPGIVLFSRSHGLAEPAGRWVSRCRSGHIPSWTISSPTSRVHWHSSLLARQHWVWNHASTHVKETELPFFKTWAVKAVNQL